MVTLLTHNSELLELMTPLPLEEGSKFFHVIVLHVMVWCTKNMIFC